MLLCVGDFFANDNLSDLSSYKNGSKKAPIATYFVGPNHQEHVDFFNSGPVDGFEYCENITYLGAYKIRLL